MLPIIHFDVYADDPARAAKFYTQVFGWRIEKWDNPMMDYWLITTTPTGEKGIEGGMAKRETPTSQFDTNLAVGVDSAEAIIQKATQHGGRLVVPIEPIPTVGWYAKIADTEGNIFGVMQADPEAR